jgi:hypothetical protein
MFKRDELEADKRRTAAAQMSETKPTKLSLEKVLHLLRKPDARLVRLHSNNGGAGFYVWPNGGHVSNEVVQLLLGRNDIQPYGSGVFPGGGSCTNTLAAGQSCTFYAEFNPASLADQQQAFQGAKFGWQKFFADLERVVGGLS